MCGRRAVVERVFGTQEMAARGVVNPRPFCYKYRVEPVNPQARGSPVIPGVVQSCRSVAAWIPRWQVLGHNQVTAVTWL
jgi:hypothetical protein